LPWHRKVLPMASDAVIVARNHLAGLYANGKKPDREVEAQARRNLTAAKLERAVREAVAAFPPLTDEQRGRVVRLLMTGGGADA